MILTYEALIGDSLVQHTKLTLLNEETLSYYIDPTQVWTYLSRYPVLQYGTIQTDDIEIYTLTHEENEKNFIRNTFNKLDNIIDLDFKEMSHNNGSMLDIYKVNYSSTFEEDHLGQAISQRSEYGSWWEILWKKTNIIDTINSNIDLNTIVHEIGHCLGLSHPFNDPNNREWDSSDTVMSYNRSPNGWDTWFSEHDINALIRIWGRENDLGEINYDKKSSSYDFKKTNDNKYMIHTEIGLENITEIKTLSFSDKSINVKEEIIGLFDLLDGVDTITGKIYRLYNAAFGRFPDLNGLKYWIETNKQEKDTYKKTAESFILSEEFNILYGMKPSNKDYIDSLYSNVL